MRHDYLFRRQVEMLVVAYGCFCVGVVGFFFLIEMLLFERSGAIWPPGFIPMTVIVRWGVLFLSGIPFIMLLIKHQMDQERLAATDDVTGLCNRLQLFDALRWEVTQARRYNQELSVMMIDVDNFKSINDRYGHLAGDKILWEIGAVLAKMTREVDIAGRYGGDEFLVILPQSAYYEAQQLAWMLWAHVYRHPFKFKGESICVSISTGISSLRNLGIETDPYGLIHHADQAMFKSKGERFMIRSPTLAS